MRKALGRATTDPHDRTEAEAYIAAHAQGPRPVVPGDLASHFLQRATDMESTVERLAAVADLPPAVARYIETVEPAAARTGAPATAGVCWPEFAALDWAAAGLAIEPRPTQGHDRLGITGCYCAIAETGTLVFLSGADTPTATALLPDIHVAVVRRDRVVAGMEDAFALIRSERGAMPRAMNMISGPSRTGDIEQTIVLGAHGPYRVHILLLG